MLFSPWQVPLDDVRRVLDFRLPSSEFIFSLDVVGELFNSIPSDRLRGCQLAARDGSHLRESCFLSEKDDRKINPG